MNSWLVLVHVVVVIQLVGPVIQGSLVGLVVGIQLVGMMVQVVFVVLADRLLVVLHVVF